jgi:hypothetical protein
MFQHEWQVAGFPGTWDEWWKRWWDNHLAEHKEWLAWLNANSKIGFRDWQERQKAASAAGSKSSK